jgi:hypothetical protein
MNGLISYNYNFEKAEKEGIELYKNNDFFHSLSNIMEHPEYKDFFGKYIKDWTDVKTVMMFIKLYESIGYNCKQDAQELNGYHKLSILKNIMSDSKLRRTIVSKVNKSDINILK